MQYHAVGPIVEEMVLGQKTLAHFVTAVIVNHRNRSQWGREGHVPPYHARRRLLDKRLRTFAGPSLVE